MSTQPSTVHTQFISFSLSFDRIYSTHDIRVHSNRKNITYRRCTNANINVRMYRIDDNANRMREEEVKTTHTNRKWNKRTNNKNGKKLIRYLLPLPLSVWYESESYCWISGAVFCCCSAVITRGISIETWEEREINKKKNSDWKILLKHSLSTTRMAVVGW